MHGYPSRRASPRMRRRAIGETQMAVTMPDTLREYVLDPRWVPVDAYGRDERAMNMERGMLVERGRVVLRVFCP